MMALMIKSKFASSKKGKSYKSFTASVNREDLDYISKLIDEGKLKTVIDKIYPLEKSAEAMEYLETARAKGKVVIDLTV